MDKRDKMASVLHLVGGKPENVEKIVDEIDEFMNTLNAELEGLEGVNGRVPGRNTYICPVPSISQKVGVSFGRKKEKKRDRSVGPDGEVCRDLICAEEWKDPETRKVLTEYHRQGLTKGNGRSGR